MVGDDKIYLFFVIIGKSYSKFIQLAYVCQNKFSTFRHKEQ